MSAGVPARMLSTLPAMAARPKSVRRTQIVGQEFQRDGLLELEIVGAVHLAHAAAPERRDDAEAAGEERAGGTRPQPAPLDEEIVDVFASPEVLVTSPARVRSSIAPQRLWVCA
jgi:hypothetical protein